MEANSNQAKLLITLLNLILLNMMLIQCIRGSTEKCYFICNTTKTQSEVTGTKIL
jgi:hypothetical protein